MVDDEKTLRDVARLLLEGLGYRVMLAEDGLHAVDVFKQHMQQIDLVLLDLTMPNMDGEACLKILKQLRADIPVVISSGYSEVKHIQSDGFLPKPYSIELLQEKVLDALKNK